MQCRRCGKLERERLDFMADNPFYTKRFSHYVGRRCRQGTNNLKTQLEAKIQIESAVNPRVCGVCLITKRVKIREIGEIGRKPRQYWLSTIFHYIFNCRF